MTVTLALSPRDLWFGLNWTRHNMSGPVPNGIAHVRATVLTIGIPCLQVLLAWHGKVTVVPVAKPQFSGMN